jgi:uncharacterized Zn finger protein
LHAELVRSPLGQILSSALKSDDVPAVEPVDSYYTRPSREPAAVETSHGNSGTSHGNSGTSHGNSGTSHKEFWTGAKRLPAPLAATAQASVPALLIKKQGDYPPFWHKDMSFISVMEELYDRVRTKNRQMK